ncbi:hypothetical protein [Anaerovibrio sp.]|uniref:hypothetical protein n=1 Tax=Anaerovibrio sp. TaxID=1872532 RepID=UPI003F1756AD
MPKISYITQMNSFMARALEDALPANAVLLYLMLFHNFNRARWRNEWMKFTICQLMGFTHVGSPNTIYSIRSLLKELGYIDYRASKNGSRTQMEYRLIPLNEQEKGEFPAREYPAAEGAKKGCGPDRQTANDLSQNEYSQIEHSKYEKSKTEHSKTERSGEFSGELSKSEHRTDNSPNREEEEKTKNPHHATSAKYVQEKNITGRTDTAGESAIQVGRKMTVNEFCRTNGDYLLCADAYREYFHREPPSKDRVKLIRFLASYGASVTLQALDIMMRNGADSLDYCEGVLRRMQWQTNKNAARQTAPRPHSDWQGWRMA